MLEQVGIEFYAIDDASPTINRLAGSLRTLGRAGSGTSALGQLGGILGKGLSSATANLERWATRAAFVAGGVGIEAVRWSLDFQKNMALLGTQAGASPTEIAYMTAGIKGLVSTVATGPVELAKMAYHLESVGLRGKDALDALKVAALGVKIGLVDDAEAVSTAMAAIKYSGIPGVKSYSQSMATLVAIVGQGNVRMQDLVQSFSTGVLGTAKTYGVSIQSLGAAFTVLTDAGVKAPAAMYRLGYSLTQLGAPTKAALKNLKSIGIGQYDLSNDLRKPDGIFVALTDLKNHLAKAGMMKGGVITAAGQQLIASSFGRGRFSASIMQLLGMLDRIPKKYDAILGSVGQFDAKVAATQATGAYQISQLWANIQNIGVGIGDALAPGLLAVNAAINGWIGANGSNISGALSGLQTWFSGFAANMLKVDWGSIAKGIGDAAGFVGDLISAFAGAPDWVKQLLIGGFVLNKFTGGMVTDLAGWAAKLGLNAITGGLRGGVGGAIAGATGAVPVWVVGANPGVFGPGGGLPGGPEPVPESGIKSWIKTAASAVATAAIPAMIAYGSSGANIDDLLNPTRPTTQAEQQKIILRAPAPFGFDPFGWFGNQGKTQYVKESGLQPGSGYLGMEARRPGATQQTINTTPTPGEQNIAEKQEQNRLATQSAAMTASADSSMERSLLAEMVGLLAGILAKPVAVFPGAAEAAAAGAALATYGADRARQIGASPSASGGTSWGGPNDH